MIRVLLALLAVALLLAGVQTWRVERLKPQLAEARAAIAEWEGYREAAQTSADDAAKACDARVADARRSAQRIASLMELPHATDPAGCPVRSLLPDDLLREAVSPSADPAA